MRRQAVVDHGLVDGVGLGGDLEPGGGSLASGTDRNVVQEHMPDEPGPPLAPWGLVGLDAPGQLGLQQQRVGLGLGRARHEHGAKLGVGGQHPVVADQVESWGRDEGAEACEQVLGRDAKWLGQAAELAVTAVLHTWSRELRFHPHVHCIVSGGGLATEGRRWVPAARDFLFPVHVLGALFRGKVLAAIEQAHRDGRLVLPTAERGRGFRRRLRRLYAKSWVVYAKRPFGGPEQVVRYLGRYTHRVAISNARLVAADDAGITFRTRAPDTVTLPGVDFVRRFLDHVLPKGFVKIRHYGLLASGHVRSRLARAQALLSRADAQAASDRPRADDEQADDELDWPALLLRLTGIDLRLCPRCHQPTLLRLPLGPSLQSARAPPRLAGAAA